MKTVFRPRGVCSQKFEITLEDGRIEDIKITGGCHGNLQGIAALVKGQDAREVVERLRGIRCGFKSTSCPDQIALALEKALEEENA